MSKKSYPFTLNNYTDEEVELFKEFTHEHLTHLYIGKEVGEKGTPHLQGFVAFEKTKRWTGIQKMSPVWARVSATTGKTKGSVKQNRDYCLKDGDVLVDFGDPGAGKRNDLKDFKDAILSGATKCDLYMDFCGMMAKYPKFYEGLRKHYLKLREYPPGLPSRTREVKVEIHWGKSGGGKSHYAHALGACKLDLASKGWFDGYDDDEVVVIEEFDWQKFDIDFAKNLFDDKPVLLNIKGTAGYANWNRVILTSNNDPSGWWPNASQEDRDAFMGRITEIVYYPKASALNKRKATVYRTAE